MVKENEVAQSCPTLCDPVDHNLPGSPVHGIFPGKSTGVGCHFLFQDIVVKNPPVNAGDVRDTGTIPELGRFPILA